MEQTRSFVTGGTGFIGRHLVDRLLARGQHVTLLVRPATFEARPALFEGWRDKARAHGGELAVLAGDVTARGLGLDEEHLEELRVDALDHVFHVAGVYDLLGDEETMKAVNVEGTRHVLGLLVDRGFRGVLHHVSSVAVAGKYEGRFGEDMLHEKQRFQHPYHRTKFESEALVRAETRVRWRIYRPSAVVGHSATGAMDRIDGPYFMFRAIHKIRSGLPPWVTLPGLDGPRIDMVPVDFVADAIDAIAHREGLDGKGFHLVDPAPPKFVDSFNLVADAAGAPRMSRRRLGKLAKMIPGAGNVLSQLGSLKFIRRELSEDFGIPAVVRDAANADVEHDTRNVEAALVGTGVRCPRQEEYVEALWDYYLRHLDPARDKQKRNRELFSGKRVLITGGSSGIGAQLGAELATAGAHVVLVARREKELQELVERLRAEGGRADYAVADLSDLDACDGVIADVQSTHGPIDVLVNNAGKSIRRPLAESLDRFHDLERVMQINYFGPARLIRGVLPTMRERGGHIVNVLSAGAHFPSPRFGAYTASKAALSQLADVLATEHLHEDVRVTNAYLHWVRTPMMDATGKYEDTDAMSPADAVELILDGIANRKQHIGRPTDLRRFASAKLYPNGITRVVNLLYRIYSDDPNAHPEVSLDRMLLERFVKGRLM